MEKIVCIKSIFENGRWRMYIPHPTPLDPSLAISDFGTVSHFQSLWHRWYCSFLLKGKVKKGPWHNGLPLNRLLRAGFRQ